MAALHRKSRMSLVSEFLGQLTLQLGGVSFHTNLFIYVLKKKYIIHLTEEKNYTIERQINKLIFVVNISINDIIYYL